jgi:hypothetical protein
MAKLKTFTYHKSLSFIDAETNEKHSFATQLYQIGVYGIMNNNSASQGSYEPNQLVKAEAKFKKYQEAGVIKDLVFGESITVAKVDGFWKEVQPEA